MGKRVTPPKRVTSPTWGPPPPCKQALSRTGLFGGPGWHIATKKNTQKQYPPPRRIPWQKKIAFRYSDAGDTLENKLNDLKPLYSLKKSFAFQKKLKKILSPWRVDCSQSHIFSWDRLDISRLTVTGILIFKCTNGADVGDYSSGRGEKNRGTVITSLQLAFTERVAPATQAFDWSLDNRC